MRKRLAETVDTCERVAHLLELGRTAEAREKFVKEVRGCRPGGGLLNRLYTRLARNGGEPEMQHSLAGLSYTLGRMYRDPDVGQATLIESYCRDMHAWLEARETRRNPRPQQNVIPLIRDRMTIDNKATACKISHPTWNRQEIADAIGCPVKSLRRDRCPTYYATCARVKTRDRQIRGEKTRQGDIEAWDA